MEEEKQVERRSTSVSLPDRLGLYEKKVASDEAGSQDPNVLKKYAAQQREQEFKTLQLKHRHKCEMDALKKVVRQKDEEIENLKQQFTTQEEQNAAYREEIEKQSKILKDNESKFEKRLNQLKTNLEKIHLQELEDKVTRVRKEEQSTAKLQIEELKEQIDVAKRIQKNGRKNEEDYQVTLLQLQVKDLQSQITELKRTQSGEQGAKETLLKKNKELMEEVNTSTKKMKDVDGTMKQLVLSKMQFVEKSTAEIARLHQELSIARSELEQVKSELAASKQQVAAQAAQVLRMSASPRTNILTSEKKTSKGGRRSSIPELGTFERKSSRARSFTSPKSEIPPLERKSSRNGIKSQRSQQPVKKQRVGMKSSRSDQSPFEKKQQRAARKSIGSEDILFDKKQPRALRKSQWSEKFQRTEQPLEKKEQRGRRKSTGSPYITLDKQLKTRSPNTENLQPVKKSHKTEKKLPRTQHISVKKQRRNGVKNGMRSKSPKTEHIDKKHLRRRSSVPKSKTFEPKVKLTKTKSVGTDEHKSFAISRDGSSLSRKKRSKSFRRAKSRSLLINPKEQEKRRRGSRPF